MLSLIPIRGEGEETAILDEINRIPLKSQSAFLEGLQDRTVTVGKTTYELPAFSFAIATMNPVELGQGGAHGGHRVGQRGDVGRIGSPASGDDDRVEGHLEQDLEDAAVGGGAGPAGSG